MATVVLMICSIKYLADVRHRFFLNREVHNDNCDRLGGDVFHVANASVAEGDAYRVGHRKMGHLETCSYSGRCNSRSFKL